ncbi:hypothetical protein EI94DRAFT_547071 [Lactarius quietus]|nr:hypothetical protein EI94DRAFT_547071 [Lactarius quietus]
MVRMRLGAQSELSASRTRRDGWLTRDVRCKPSVASTASGLPEDVEVLPEGNGRASSASKVQSMSDASFWVPVEPPGLTNPRAGYRQQWHTNRDGFGKVQGVFGPGVGVSRTSGYSRWDHTICGKRGWVIELVYPWRKGRSLKGGKTEKS